LSRLSLWFSHPSNRARGERADRRTRPSTRSRGSSPWASTGTRTGAAARSRPSLRRSSAADSTFAGCEYEFLHAHGARARRARGSRPPRVRPRPLRPGITTPSEPTTALLNATTLDATHAALCAPPPAQGRPAPPSKSGRGLDGFHLSLEK